MTFRDHVAVQAREALAKPDAQLAVTKAIAAARIHEADYIAEQLREQANRKPQVVAELMGQCAEIIERRAAMIRKAVNEWK